MADVSKSIVLRSLCDAVPVCFPCGVDGTATVSCSRLATKFQLQEASIHVDCDVYDAVSNVITHSVAQKSSFREGLVVWNLECGKYSVYGVPTTTS